MSLFCVLLCYAQCRYAKCHYTECCYAECHYAACHYVDSRYAQCHYAEGRGAVDFDSFSLTYMPEDDEDREPFFCSRSILSSKL
jgi:hypothetical protein